jgi:signal transduction histidine kinase
MLLPTSPEFLALCQSQLWLLTQNLGAAMGVVYLTEELCPAEGQPAEKRLVPIATIPTEFVTDEGQLDNSMGRLALPQMEMPPLVKAIPSTTTSAMTSAMTELATPDRLVLPLIHEELVLGVLVTERRDRAWTMVERQQVEQVVQTISLACVLDQRSQWLRQQQQQQGQIQAQQHDLMDNLVHQFRNPLTALRTFGKLLLRRLPEGDTNREVATSIVRESDRLQELLLQIDRAIDLNQPLEESAIATSAITTMALPMAGVLGDGKLALSPCDVRQILEPLLQSAKAVAEEKDIVIRTGLPEVMPLITGNESALREVLSNLIDNAVKYTPDDGEVHVLAQVSATQMEIWVTDNGRGIPDGDLPSLFQRHFRGVQAQTAIPGTGLGLAIARELAQQMQGDIQVFSPLRSMGWLGSIEQLVDVRGCTFILTLQRLSQSSKSQSSKI